MCRGKADLALMGHLLRTWRRTGTRLKSHAELHATTITLVMALVIVLIDMSRGKGDQRAVVWKASLASPGQ